MLSKEKLLNHLNKILERTKKDDRKLTDDNRSVGTIAINTVLEILIYEIREGKFDDKAYKDLLEDYKKLEEAYNCEMGYGDKSYRDNLPYKVSKIEMPKIGDITTIELPTFKKD